MIAIRMEIFKHMIPSRWLILNLHFISSFFIMLVSWRYPWDITPSYYSRQPFHRMNSLMTNLCIIWQASSIWSLWYVSSWTCTSFLLSLSCWCLEGTQEITPSYSSRYTCNRLNPLMTNLWITPWTSWSTLDILHFLLLSTLMPPYGSNIAYGQILNITQCKH